MTVLTVLIVEMGFPKSVGCSDDGSSVKHLRFSTFGPGFLRKVKLTTGRDFAPVEGDRPQ